MISIAPKFLTGQMIASRYVNTTYPNAIQMQGVDLSLATLKKVGGDYIYPHPDSKMYSLDQGVYELTYKESIRRPIGIYNTIKTRSSLVRNGCVVGDNLLYVYNPVTIAQGARVAQIMYSTGTQPSRVSLLPLHVKCINKLTTPGTIPRWGKTVVSPTTPANLYSTGEYELTPGYYEVLFEESVTIPNDRCAVVSTVSNTTCRAVSGLYDAGYSSNQVGCFIVVELPTKVRIKEHFANLVGYESYPVTKPYNGQYQQNTTHNDGSTNEC